MKSRLAVALTAAALLALTGCSGSGTAADTGRSAPTTTGPSTTAGAPATAPAGTGSPAGTATSTRTVTPTPVIGPVQASREATRALTAANEADGRTGKGSKKARRSAWTGEALRAAEGDARVAKGEARRTRHTILAPVHPNVLAISRGDGHPAFLVVQTEPSTSELPLLHLMRADRPTAKFHLALTAAMLPGTALRSFDPTETGSVVVKGTERHGRAATATLAELAVKPKTLLTAYAKHLDYPHRKGSTDSFATDRFASSVRAGAAQQADAVQTQADFSQSHRLLGDSVVTVQQQDGGALVFAVLERKDTFDIKPGQTVKPTKAFQVFAPDQQKIEISAQLTTLEFVVFEVPAKSGKATLVAASEHLVGAKGH